MDQQQVSDLLTKYRLGRCTEEEKAAITQWYASAAKAQPDLPENLDLEAAREHSWTNILAAVRPHTFDVRQEARVRPVVALYMAAAVAAMLCIGFFWFGGGLRDQNAGSAARMVTASALPGEVKTYRLPDSSLVTLNGGTSIRFPGKFGGGAREIVITDGEAYFDVKHDAEHPFVVNAGRTQTQVLGTVFSVRAYRSLSDVRVTVASGKVGVRNASGYPEMQTAFLLPDEQLVVDNQSGGVRKGHVQAHLLAGWIRGALDFNNEDLKTIALLLEKKFNVPVRVDGKRLEEQRLTARFRAEETLDDILGTLAMAGSFSYRHAAGQVLISMNEH
ncbi:FecR family protein [Dyadobacter sp. SG02]|uniref:FecR family protein n=1 Tax=Dyadobacter sp. SG02 TaxID=1855291 RepID=UPI0008C27450|nr:FecR domain-containing protein [Dyadobacter sp. SG02]SEJ24559.1 FecR family protein [Dyadobacter sp. SG02]